MNVVLHWVLVDRWSEFDSEMISLMHAVYVYCEPGRMCAVTSLVMHAALEHIAWSRADDALNCAGVT